MRMRRRAAIFLACSAALAGTGCSAQTSDEQRFVAKMIQQIKARVPGAEIVRHEDPLSVSIKGGGQIERTFNFHRLYAYCQRTSAADCKATRGEFIDMVLRHHLPPVMTAASLRIAVRDAEYVQNAREGQQGTERLVAEPIGDDLFAILVSDAPDSTSTVPPNALASLGLTREQAWAQAWRQTRAKLPALPTTAALREGAALYADQDYLASLLADTSGWTALAKAAGPDLLVTVVADDNVFVARMPDGPRLESFRQAVRTDCAGQLRCVSPNLYRFRDGRWVVSR